MINTLNQPNGVHADNNRLYIVDTNNSRVLIYNSIPAANNASADIVLGAPDFTSVNILAGANGLNAPRELTVTGNKLIVLDSGSSRALIYNNSIVTPLF